MSDGSDEITVCGSYTHGTYSAHPLIGESSNVGQNSGEYSARNPELTGDELGEVVALRARLVEGADGLQQLSATEIEEKMVKKYE